MKMYECWHEWGDPTCCCHLEAMIEERQRRERIKELFGFDLNTPEFKQEYYRNAKLYSITNALELVVEKYDEVCDELEWACEYILGDTNEGRESAKYRANSTLRRLGAVPERRTMYGSNGPEHLES